VAQALVVPLLGRPDSPAPDRSSLKSPFFTDD
jgi:hypothetical protein